MEICKVIEKINMKNNSEIFELKNISDVEIYLSSLGPLTYIGHGGLSFCFSLGNKQAIKCCKKTRGTIVVSKETFLSNVQRLKDVDMPILLPIEVLYENESWLIYSQPLCRPLALFDISPKLCSQIFDFVSQMIKTNIRISDIFYRNFGIHQGKLFLFDFHEVDSFQSSPNFLITNLYSTFTFLGKNVGWPILDIGLINIDFVIKDNFGKNRFPDPIVKFLQTMHLRDYSKSLEHISVAQVYLKNKIKRKFTKYQQVIIDENGFVNLSSHTLSKYNLAKNIIKEKKILTVFDARCCSGGIGLKIAQKFPNLFVSIGNSDQNELNKVKQMANDCMIFNVSVVSEQLIGIKSKQQKYDLVLCYSLFHHLLKTVKIDEILRIIKLHMSKYCIIELPIKGDALLNRVMKIASTPENFECLASPEIARYYLVINKLKVDKCVKIDYNDDRLNRYAYICSI